MGGGKGVRNMLLDWKDLSSGFCSLSTAGIKKLQEDPKKPQFSRGPCRRDCMENESRTVGGGGGYGEKGKGFYRKREVGAVGSGEGPLPGE